MLLLITQATSDTSQEALSQAVTRKIIDKATQPAWHFTVAPFSRTLPGAEFPCQLFSPTERPIYKATPPPQDMLALTDLLLKFNQ